MIKRFADIETMLQDGEKQRVVGVVCAHDEHALEAIKRAKDEQLIHAVLIGDEEEIQRIMIELKMSSDGITIIPSNDDSDSAELGVMLAKKQEVDVLMKGKIQTRDFLKAVVNSEKGIRMPERLLSHVTLEEVPSYHKLLGITDAGMVMHPDLQQKRQLIENAVSVFERLGNDTPKVAVLGAVETVNPKMQDTVDAAALKELNQSGELTGCIVEGPISYDLAFSKESAMIKGYESEVTGDPDILLVPDIATGNILSKALIYTAGAKMAGIVTGAEVPIVLTSRGASADEKYYSILLASICS